MYKTQIVPPVIISESGDVDVFESVEDAEKYLEPVDVRAGRFVAFDSEGRSLLLYPTSPRISIALAEETPSHAEELSVLLKRFLGQVGVAHPSLESDSLPELIEKSLVYKVR